MLTVDWGDSDEHLIVIRIENQCTVYDIKWIRSQMMMMLQSSSYATVDLIIDLRCADEIPADFIRLINQILQQHSDALDKVIAIVTVEQHRTLHIVANFYPSVATDIIAVQSVEQAYRLISAVA